MLFEVYHCKVCSLMMDRVKDAYVTFWCHHIQLMILGPRININVLNSVNIQSLKGIHKHYLLSGLILYWHHYIADITITTTCSLPFQSSCCRTVYFKDCSNHWGWKKLCTVKTKKVCPHWCKSHRWNRQ